MGNDLREIEVCDGEEEERASDEDVIVVFVDVSESRRAGLRNCERSEPKT